MTQAERIEGSYPELFPKDFADRLGIHKDRVVEWRKGTVPTGGEVWHIMRLAWSIPSGIEVMLPESAEHYRRPE